ncbi:hypothetical protein [Saccharothrix sp. ST-888]|uniref:hypothetical protein n=1 Tax=Saccharothrix sp. ST-888 TaxID=1427391 RepID=UPI0012DFF03A|nr:hypothetical protein [Saccharothrix sp. ST-888]
MPAPTAAAPPQPGRLAGELSGIGGLRDELPLEGGVPLTATPAIAEYLARTGPAGGRVPVRLGSVAAGTLLLRQTEAGLATGPGDGFQPVPLLHPLFLPLRDRGIEPVLAVRTTAAGALEGHAAALVKGRLVGGPRGLIDQVETYGQALGWTGLSRLRLPGVVNELRGRVLTVQATGMRFELGGFLSATGTFGLANETVAFDATATGTVPGLGTVTVPITRGPDGALTGEAVVDVALRGFTGQLAAVFAGGVVDVRGSVGYTGEKLGGRLTLVATDAASARELTDGLVAGAEPPAPTAPAAPRPGPRVVAGWGTVDVRLADWLGGAALVVVDHLGDVTVVGKITPHLEKPLFEAERWAKDLPKLEVRALYGIPLVGNVFVFANIGLGVFAGLGPGTLQRMELTGTWSTKPEVLKNFALTGTLDVPISAGVRLTAQGGAGVELVGHDIKFGVGIDATAAIRGYLQATPRIGYREVADPGAGKHGEFFLGGHLELAARPSLALGGELFVDLVSPWWSPAPSRRWDWPLGQLEYPLPGEFGIGADLADYVLGSGRRPELTFGEVAFSADKFMGDLLGRQVPQKSGADEARPGGWQDTAAPGAPAPQASAPKSPAPKAPAAKAAKPARPAGPAAPPTAVRAPQSGNEAVPSPAKQNRWLGGLQALGGLAEHSHQDPLDTAGIRDALAGLRRTYGFTELTAELQAGDWVIAAGMSPRVRNVARVSARTAATAAGGQPPDVAPPGHVYRGGLYKDLKDPVTRNNVPGTEINHIPPNSVVHLDTNGPAIQMDRRDHKETASWGSWATSKEHRTDQRNLIGRGRYHGAIQKDIDDIRSKFGAKYNRAVREMLNVMPAGWW